MPISHKERSDIIREASGGIPASHRVRYESPDGTRVTRDVEPDGTRVTRDEDPDGTRVTRDETRMALVRLEMWPSRGASVECLVSRLRRLQCAVGRIAGDLKR